MSAASPHLLDLAPFTRLALGLELGEGADSSPSRAPWISARMSPPPFLARRISGSDALGRLLAFFRPFLAGGGQLYCIDGCNGFAPQLLALMAAEFGEESLLECVMVSRAYTVHQLVSAIKTLPIAVDRGSACLLILGYDHLFYADDLPLWERCHLHHRGIEAMQARHAAQHLPTLVTLEGGEQSPWCRELLRSS